MLIQLDWRFWLCTVVLFVFVRLETPFSRSTWFGLLNLIPLGVLLGGKAVFAIAAFSALLWAALHLARRLADAFDSSTIFFVFISFAIVGMLAAQKLAAEFLPIGSDPSLPLSLLRLLQLVAFSYVALRAWDAVASVRDGEEILSPIGLCGFLAPFFMMPAGPINVYADHVNIDRTSLPALTTAAYIDGIEQVTRGLFIKFCLADGLRIFAIGANSHWPDDSFLWSVAIFLYIYLDFWGYSVIALGIGALLQVPTPVNFDKPLRSRSLSEFWMRWHMSLGDFVKRRIYFPLQIAMMRRSERMHVVNSVSLICAFTFVGLWHRFTLPFVAWGVFFGIVLSLEKVVGDALAPKFFAQPWVRTSSTFIGPAYTLIIIIGMLHLTAMAQMVGG